MNTTLRLLCLSALGAAAWISLPSDAAGQATAPSPPQGAVSPMVPESVTPNLELAPVQPNQPMTVNALLGFVNSEPVYVDDMLRPLDAKLREAGKAHNLTEFRSEARPMIESELHYLIRDILISSAAKASLTDDDKTKLDAYMALERTNLLTKYGGSQARADEALRAQQSSVDKEMKNLRRKWINELFLRKTIYPKIVVTRQMVLDEYNRDPKKWQQDAEIELFTLTLPVSRELRAKTDDGTVGALIKDPTQAQIKEAENKTMAQARSLVEQLKKGADFAVLVTDNSGRIAEKRSGGRTPHLKKGSLVNQALENYAFSLPANTLGDPMLIEDPNPEYSAVVIVKVGEKKEARTIPFAEAQEEIQRQLREEQRLQLMDDYLDRLAKEGAVERVDRMANVALDVAVTRYATP